MATSRRSVGHGENLSLNDAGRELFEACRNGDLSKVKKLVNPHNVNAKDTAGRKSSPLHFAAGSLFFFPLLYKCISTCQNMSGINCYILHMTLGSVQTYLFDFLSLGHLFSWIKIFFKLNFYLFTSMVSFIFFVSCKK